METGKGINPDQERNDIGMATISKDDFLSCLRASEIIDEEHLQEKLAQINSDNPKEIVTTLIREQLLTKWQAKQLISGRSRLRIGNYRLLERIRRDEFGDRLFAVHERLHRLVEIQLFPASLNDEKELRDHFLEVASLAATLDHPNLMHVFDIDKEGGRFFLVVEHAKGDTLDTFQSNELSDLDVARIVDQVITGLENAHEHKVVHGDIKPENLLVTEQEQVKILNLAMASLLNPQHETVSPVSDLQAIGKLGIQLLAMIDGGDEEAKTDLQNILTAIAETESTNLESQKIDLAGWIEANDDSTRHTVISSVPVEKNEPAPLSEHVPAQAPVKPANASGKQPVPQQFDMDSVPFVQRHGIAILATAAAVCILILGGTAYMTLLRGNEADEFQPVATKGALDGAPPVVTDSTLSGTKNTGKGQLSPIKNDKEQQFLANRPDNIDMDKALKEAKAQLESGNIGDSESGKEQAANNQAAQPPQPKPEKNKQAAPESTPPMATVAAPATTEPDKTQPAKTAEVSTDVVANKPPAKKAEFTEEQLAKPFQNIPRTIDLGDIANTTPTPLGPVFIPSNFLMACELISGREISRSKFSFELERSTDDKQRWHVNFKKRKNSPPEKIGSFFRKDNVLNFQWEPNAAENDNFNYIRNCVLKLTGKNQATSFVNLRKAIPVEGLFINAEQGSNKVETALQWLPNPEDLIIEVDLPSYQGVPKMYPFPATRRISKKQPVNLVFNDSANKNYIYLQLSAEFRKSLKLQLALLFDPGNGKTQVVDKKLLDELVAQLSSIADAAASQSQQANAAQRPQDVKSEDFDKWKSDLKKGADLALSRKNSVLQYNETLPKLYGKQIPLRVFFKMDNHEIILAQSFQN